MLVAWFDLRLSKSLFGVSDPDSFLFPRDALFAHVGPGKEVDDTTLHRHWQQIQMRLAFEPTSILSLQALRSTFAVRSVKAEASISSVVVSMGFADADSIDVFLKRANNVTASNPAVQNACLISGVPLDFGTLHMKLFSEYVEGRKQTEEGALRSSSVTTYRAFWGKIGRWLSARKVCVRVASVVDLKMMVDDMIASGAFSTEMSARYLRLIHQVLSWHAREKREPLNDAASRLQKGEGENGGYVRHAARGEPECYSPVQQTRIEQWLATPFEGWHDARDKTIIALMYYVGLKPTEARQLKIGQIKRCGSYGMVRTRPIPMIELPGNGLYYARKVQIPEQAVKLLLAWFDLRLSKSPFTVSRPDSFLFPVNLRSWPEKEIDDTTLHRIWQRVQQRLTFGAEEILSLHALRNTFAVRALREAFAAGGGAENVIGQMGFVGPVSIKLFVKRSREG